MHFRPDSPHIALLPPSIPSAAAVINGPLALGLRAYRARDYWGAFLHWKLLADRRDDEGLFLVGTMYALGHGVKQNLPVALDLLTDGTARGNSRAAFNAAMVGMRIDMPAPKLLAYLRLAAESIDDSLIVERCHRVAQAVGKALSPEQHEAVRRMMSEIMAQGRAALESS